MLQEQGIVFNQNNNEFKDNSNGIVLNNNESINYFYNARHVYTNLL